MLNTWFVMFLDAVPILLAFGVLAFVLVGFWRGLSLRPHEPENRASPPPFWWYNGP